MRPNTEIEALTNGLARWVQEAPGDEDREEAKDKIRVAFIHNTDELDIYNNKLTTLPSEIWNLTQLKHLQLPSNQLTNLSPDIRNLTQLTTLSLSSNQLTNLPSEIGDLTQLRRFSLRNNQLTTLPSEIENLTQLTLLYLDNNQLTTIPESIFTQDRSESLVIHLDNNNFSRDEVVRLQNLSRDNPSVRLEGLSINDRNPAIPTNSPITPTTFNRATNLRESGPRTAG